MTAALNTFNNNSNNIDSKLNHKTKAFQKYTKIKLTPSRRIPRATRRRRLKQPRYIATAKSLFCLPRPQ